MFVYNSTTENQRIFENHLKYYENDLINYLIEMKEETFLNEDFTNSTISNQQSTIKFLTKELMHEYPLLLCLDIIYMI